jgi:TolB-like protein
MNKRGKVKMKKNNFCFLTILFAIVVFCIAALIQAPLSSAEEPEKLAIVPFAIYADRDIGFVRDGILEMLASRLYVKDRLAVIEKAQIERTIGDYKEPLDLTNVSGLGNKVGADYVLFGSLTVLGRGVSLDTTLVSLKKERPPVKIFVQSVDMESFMPKINELVEKINAEISGKVYAGKPVEKTQQLPEPEKAAEGRVPPLKPGEGAFQKVDFGLASLWESTRFEVKILGMAVGDVDGDNQNEVVFISNKDVFISRKVNDKLRKIGEVRGKSYYNFIGVDVADMNGNGKSEIFITNLRKGNTGLQSFVLEWNGASFTKIVDGEDWYYRVLQVPGRGKVLLGQKRGAYEVFKEGVFEMEWNHDRYVPKMRQALPNKLNIYGFTYGDVLNNAEEMIVAFTQKDHVRIMDSEGHEKWTSIERYGGTDLYLELPTKAIPSEGWRGDREEAERLYVAQRIHVADLDNDGKNEVIVVKNKDVTGQLFPRLKFFKSGFIECLVWDDIALVPKWKTQEISGFISDYVIGDVNNDGINEVVFSVVAQSKAFIRKAKSYIVTWGISG